MYKIIFSERSLSDINEISNIIFNFTLSEKITNTIYKNLILNIQKLEYLPFMFVEYGYYRVMTIDKKYRVFYKINEKKKIVKIHRIFFSSSNYQEII
jgi:plasmid stabilization system protein ParE